MDCLSFQRKNQSVPKYFCPKWVGATEWTSVARMVISGNSWTIDITPKKQNVTQSTAVNSYLVFTIIVFLNEFNAILPLGVEKRLRRMMCEGRTPWSISTRTASMTTFPLPTRHKKQTNKQTFASPFIIQLTVTIKTTHLSFETIKFEGSVWQFKIFLYKNSDAFCGQYVLLFFFYFWGGVITPPHKQTNKTPT